MKKLASKCPQNRSRGPTVAALLLLSVASAISQDNKKDLASKFVAVGRETKSLSGYAQKRTKDGRIIIGGDVILPTSKPYEGVAWQACVNSEGRVLWSARAEEQRDAASLFLLTSDGDSIWQTGVFKNGVFRAAKFEAQSLRREASVEMAFEPITTPGGYVAFQSETDPEFDLQVSMVQSLRDSIHVALFSRDLRLILDKLYSIPLGSTSETSKALAGGYVTRLPDKSGYYLFLRNPVRADAKSSPGIGVVRLDNNGMVKWANSYVIGLPEFEAGPHVAADGSILIQLGENLLRGTRSWLIRIGPDGTANWGVTIEGEGLTVAVTDFNFSSFPYRFTEPYLFANGVQVVGSKAFSTLFAIDYGTGRIEKQVKFGPKFPGVFGFIEKTSDSLYVSFLNSIMRDPRAADVALLRFDFDLNLRAARSIRNGEPHFPILDALSTGKLLFSYSYNARKTLITETVDENFNGTSSCEVLQKADFSFTKSNFEAKPINVATTPLPPIKVVDGTRKTSEADMALVPFEITGAACTSEPSKSEPLHKRP